MSADKLAHIIYRSILEMTTADGINASAKEEIYGCIFGRDSFITILKLLKCAANKNARNYIDIDLIKRVARRSLLTLVDLQGRETNLESGEEPGKFIHEYRTEKYEHLVNRAVKPWFLYSDKTMRNFDSLDSTPLGLIAIYKYWKFTQDNEFLLKVLPSVESALNWIITYGDQDKDGLLEYELSLKRRHGGLPVQSWTDSTDSMLRPDGTFPMYPIAPVEVQGYAWLALKLWADFYLDDENKYLSSENFGRKLKSFSERIKNKFNETFIFKSKNLYFAAQALDGEKKQIRTVTGNPLLLLWASYVKEGKTVSIIEDKFIPETVNRAFLGDMFERDAGVRTMSTLSSTFNPGQNSYHNGSFWPKLNGMSHEGLISHGYFKEADLLRKAALKPIEFFGSPIELYIMTGEKKYEVFRNNQGQTSCLNQAWSAASVLDLLTL